MRAGRDRRSGKRYKICAMELPGTAKHARTTGARVATVRRGTDAPPRRPMRPSHFGARPGPEAPPWGINTRWPRNQRMRVVDAKPFTKRSAEGLEHGQAQCFQPLQASVLAGLQARSLSDVPLSPRQATAGTPLAEAPTFEAVRNSLPAGRTGPCGFETPRLPAASKRSFSFAGRQYSRVFPEEGSTS